ncbi:MAG: response regulator transcription factor [Burkholderiales bacterium]|nr:response regulator transcription factor [Burkholderiales bacterium]
MAPRIVRVLLVDDHAVVRQGLHLMLGAAADIRIDGEASNAREAMQQVHERTFDLVIADVSLPDASGLELLRMIKEERPKLPVLMLSMYTEEAYAVRAMQLGAAGYLTKTVDAGVLIEAMRKAAGGGKYVTPALAERLATALDARSPRAPHERLSTREFEVLRHIVAGTSLVEAAREMHLSPKTVTTYRARVLEKTGFSSNAELMRYALESRLFD